MAIFVDMSHFLNALRGENGEMQRIKAKQIVWRVRNHIISADEATEEFFGRESNDALFMRVLCTLRDKKKGGAVHTILNAVSVPTIRVERALEELIRSTANMKSKC